MKKVEIYTWHFCPYCVRAKALLDKEGIAYTEHEISGDSSALEALKKKTGSGTVPQIFVEGEFIGGCDDLHALHGNYENFQKKFK